jgi:hypothetical protein
VVSRAALREPHDVVRQCGRRMVVAACRH